MKKTYQKPRLKILTEIWKVYKDTRCYRKNNTVYQGHIYEVSNYGNVRKDGEIYECTISSNGYKYFSGYALHRAVAELFIPNPKNKPEVDHIDGDIYNNHVSNLRWVTHKENMNNKITKQHIAESRIGLKHSLETRRNMSINGKGKKSGPKDKHKVWDNKELNKYHFE